MTVNSRAAGGVTNLKRILRLPNCAYNCVRQGVCVYVCETVTMPFPPEIAQSCHLQATNNRNQTQEIKINKNLVARAGAT